MTMDVQQIISLLKSAASADAPSPLGTTMRALATAPGVSSRVMGILAPIAREQEGKVVAHALTAVFDALTPADLARILRELYPSDTALQVGQAILDPDVFPQTSQADLKSALSGAGFADGDVQDAVNVLYPISLTVQANVAWQQTGLDVTGRQQTVISASGTWESSPYAGPCGPGGTPAFIANQSGYTLVGKPEGALIGRVGGNPPFMVGANATAPAGQTGALSLCINDDLGGLYGAGLSDNWGSLQVNVVTR